VRRLALLPPATLLLAAGCEKFDPAPPPIAWLHDLATGRAVAAARQRPVVVYFHADWDVASKEMTKTFDDRRVREWLADCVAVEIDVTDEDAKVAVTATRELGAVGTPTLVILAPDLRTRSPAGTSSSLPRRSSPRSVRRCIGTDPASHPVEPRTTVDRHIRQPSRAGDSRFSFTRWRSDECR
jgi:hypothetical protein